MLVGGQVAQKPDVPELQPAPELQKDENQTNEKRWQIFNTVGVQLIDGGVYGLAETRLRSALVEAERFGERDFRLWATLSNLAFVCQERGELPEAERLYRRVLELRERYLGPDHPAVAASLNNLTATLHLLGRNAEADPLLRRALIIAETVEDTNLTASILNSLGAVLLDLDEPARAQPILRRAMAMFEKSEGADSLDVGKTHNNLGTVYIAEGELGRAEAELTLAASIYEKNLGPEHPLLGTVLANVYILMATGKRFDDGEPFLRRALAISEREAPASPRTQRLRFYLAALETAHHNYEAAAGLLKSVIASQELVWGANSPQVAAALERYSDVLRRMHQKTEAKRAGERAQAIFKTFR